MQECTGYYITKLPWLEILSTHHAMSDHLKLKLTNNYNKRYAKINKIKNKEIDRWKIRADYDGII